ncbi:spn-E [Symbiodinium necroappetens]|uniref:Spn-E protein n=1 Tax=Symbiodinium necroappetens TaxID=1628268 RepID=A0A812SJV7_9DINO|nr:spn-E [Symbiodinium necroappetens]
MPAKPRPPLKPPGPPTFTDRNGKGRDNKGKGGGLLLESESGGHSHFVEELNRSLNFCLVESDVQALRAWGFPLPKLAALPSPEAKLSSQSVPLITVADLLDVSLRKRIIRCAAEGVFSTVFIRFSDKWPAEHNVWVLQLCKLAFSCGTTVHLDISAWDRLRGSTVDYGLLLRPAVYPDSLVEAFGKLFMSAEGVTGDISTLQGIFGEWLQSQGSALVDWSIAPDQPYCLNALSALSLALHDCDISLFGALLQGAEADPVLLEELVQIEVDSGWLRCIDSLEVVSHDSSWTLPYAARILPVSFRKGRHEPVAAWSIDVKSAHKSIRVRESEQGLLGIRVGQKFFFYKVCPFGAAFSAFWFSRLGAFFVRALHRLIYISHFLALYVDDFLGYQAATVAEMSLCITLCFCGAFSIPLSWKKLQFGCHIKWIGWELDFEMGCVYIPTDKLEKSVEYISLALRGKYTDRQQSDWQCLVECLSNTLHLVKLPPGGAMSIGSRVLAVRHRKVHSKKELLNCSLGDKDIWLRISDPASKRRALSHDSRGLLQFWLGWAKLPPLWRSLRPQQALSVEAAADAMGNGSTFAVGGYISLPSGEYWFSECFSVSDFAFADLPLKAEAHKDISCYECLGQIALVWLLSTLHLMCKLSIKLRTWCDNSGAESASNKMFTTSWPFAAFIQR